MTNGPHGVTTPRLKTTVLDAMENKFQIKTQQYRNLTLFGAHSTVSCY